jgi:hypothetical protein
MIYIFSFFDLTFGGVGTSWNVELAVAVCAGIFFVHAAVPTLSNQITANRFGAYLHDNETIRGREIQICSGFPKKVKLEDLKRRSARQPNIATGGRIFFLNFYGIIWKSMYFA